MGYNACPSCGGRKASHAHFCRGCSPLIARGPAHYAWKGELALDTTKRTRADALAVTGPCEMCGQPGERHHKDGDPGNNRLENIALLCRRHHMLEDGRMLRRDRNGRFKERRGNVHN